MSCRSTQRHDPRAAQVRFYVDADVLGLGKILVGLRTAAAGRHMAQRPRRGQDAEAGQDVGATVQPGEGLARVFQLADEPVQARHARVPPQAADPGDEAQARLASSARPPQTRETGLSRDITRAALRAPVPVFAARNGIAVSLSARAAPAMADKPRAASRQPAVAHHRGHRFGHHRCRGQRAAVPAHHRHRGLPRRLHPARHPCPATAASPVSYPACRLRLAEYGESHRLSRWVGRLSGRRHPAP
jgi:hypothetical protein